MPYNPAVFQANVDALRAAALLYAATLRGPGVSAESMFPALRAWVALQSDAERALEVTMLEMHPVGTLSDGMMRFSDAPDAGDAFAFRLNAIYSSGGVSVAGVVVQVTRQDLEG